MATNGAARKKRVIQASDDSDDEPLAASVPKPPVKRVKAEEPSHAPAAAANGKMSQPDLSDSSEAPLASSIPAPAPKAGPSKRPAPDSSDDEKPLAAVVALKPTKAKAVKRAKREVTTEDDDDASGDGSSSEAPIAKKSKPAAKAPIKKRAPVKKAKLQESEGDASEEDVKPKTKKKKAVVKSESASTAGSPAKMGKGKGKAAKSEADDGEDGEATEEQYKWWEKQAKGDGSAKWETLEHNGVLFAPDYVPHGVMMKYKGRDVPLPPEAEEVATFFGAMLETDHAAKPVFVKNFFHDFLDVLKEHPPTDGTKITKFEDCDFRPIFDYCETERLRKKAMTKEEKKAAKAAKDLLEEPYRTCLLDGRKEKVGNFRIEPPSLFRGRGAHPKTGHLKRRVMPEQITINIGKGATVPKPPAGHEWGKIQHDNTVTWLAGWNENINGANKYVFLAAGSSLKGQSDLKKFEKARELKNHIDRIRKDYREDLTDKVMANRQRATALHLIDRFALRAGNEKGDEEADTVGCCSLRCEHITLAPPTQVTFDFLGKDSMRYVNVVDVEEQVFKNLRIFKKNKGDEDLLFDRLTTTLLNKHLGEYMKGLSAKVFRTYNASYTMQKELDEQTKADDSVADKVLAYNRANRRVAILCNHQKSVSKTHGAAMEKMNDKLRALKYQRMKLRYALFTLEPKMKKKHPELADDESDLDDEWIEAHEIAVNDKQKDAARKKFDKDVAKAAADGDDAPDPSLLESKLEDLDAELERLKGERKSKNVEAKRGMSADKILVAIEKMDTRIAAQRTAAIDKDEGKETSLGTSKINYIDPRITSAWCAKYDVPIERMFSKTLREKFTWSQVDADWRF